MTEADWMTCTDPQPILQFLRGRASDRKLRLFNCGCCRRSYGTLAGPDVEVERLRAGLHLDVLERRVDPIPVLRRHPRGGGRGGRVVVPARDEPPPGPGPGVADAHPAE